MASSLNCALLRTFTCVAELGSMTRAAEALYLAQSAVSTHVATLSSHAGGPLFERRDGKLVPTPLGRILYDEACEILAWVSALEHRLREAIAADSRRIAVSCTRTVCETSVARIVSLFARAHPGLPLGITSGTVKDAEMRLRTGESHVALVEGDVEMRGAQLAPFHIDRLLVAVPARHALAGRTTVTLDEVARYPFVLRDRTSGTRLLIEQRLGRRFKRLEIAFELEGNAEVVSCVEAGIGLALLSETAVSGALALGTVATIALADIDLSRTFHVAIPRDRTIPEGAACFADWLTSRYAKARQDLVSA
ncbi:LysR family transcriptional regulator [Vulcanimicrobium alpinum]|uniref:LysR family transcriptional regulator n=1 Tax=Vulcanimicrobium alpinum TaxID=3016050 RepID=A0AAN1XVG7_UNVUL|nr:LysR family transcriptional regulator [Vulcanimicrobium alpinum]